MSACNYKGLKVYILLDMMQHHWVMVSILRPLCCL